MIHSESFSELQQVAAGMSLGQQECLAHLTVCVSRLYSLLYLTYHYSEMNGKVVFMYVTFASGPRGGTAETVTSDGLGSRYFCPWSLGWLGSGALL